jgi:hypothetical protein
VVYDSCLARAASTSEDVAGIAIGLAVMMS